MSNSIYISIPKPPQNNIKANTPCKKCCGTIDFSLGSSTLNLSSNCYKVIRNLLIPHDFGFDGNL